MEYIYNEKVIEFIEEHLKIEQALELAEVGEFLSPVQVAKYKSQFDKDFIKTIKVYRGRWTIKFFIIPWYVSGFRDVQFKDICKYKKQYLKELRKKRKAKAKWRDAEIVTPTEEKGLVIRE